MLFALGRMEEAGQAYEQALKLVPGDAGTWNNLGAALDALGRTEEALGAFRRATECELPSQTAFVGKASIEIRLGRLDAAAATLDQLATLQRSPSAPALALRSVLERRSGNGAQADALEEQARRLDPGAAAWAIDHAGKPAVH